MQKNNQQRGKTMGEIKMYRDRENLIKMTERNKHHA